MPAFAVHRSDYESAAVALLDGDGALLDASYISSGTETPGLNAPLHGDIALASTPCAPDVLALVARAGGDYVLEVDLKENRVTRQVGTQRADPDAGAAYGANPQDVLCLDAGTALVTRFEPNLDQDADPLDAGDDVALIDMDGGRVRDRIDLSELRTTVEGTDGDGKPVRELAYARPGAIVPAGEHFAVVGLSRLSTSWIAAPGLVAVIDLEQRSLRSSFALDALENCGEVVKVAGRDDAVLVGCSGYPYGDAATAGIALLSIDEHGELSEEAALRDQDADPLFSGLVSLGGTRLVAVAEGDWTAGTGDHAFVLDLASDERTALFESDGPGATGSGAYRSETGLLLVPDAEHGVRVFEVADGELTERDPIALDAALPARAVRPLLASGK